MSSVLFDVPGPRARTRNVYLNAITLIVVAGIILFILFRFYESGQFTAEKWEIFTFPLVQQKFLEAIGATLSAGTVLALASLGLKPCPGHSPRVWPVG